MMESAGLEAEDVEAVGRQIVSASDQAQQVEDLQQQVTSQPTDSSQRFNHELTQAVSALNELKYYLVDSLGDLGSSLHDAAADFAAADESVRVALYSTVTAGVEAAEHRAQGQSAQTEASGAESGSVGARVVGAEAF